MNSLFTKHLNSSRFKGTPKKNWLASFSQDTIPEAADVWLRNRFWLRQCSGVFNIPSSGRWCFCGRWILKWKNKRCNQRCFFGVLDDMILFWYLDVQSGSSNSWFYSVMWISEVSENQSALKKAYNLVLPHIYEEKIDILGLWLKESWFQRFSCHHSSLELHSLVSHFVFTMHMWFQEVADALVSHQNHIFLAGHLQGVWEFTPLNRMGITWN